MRGVGVVLLVLAIVCSAGMVYTLGSEVPGTYKNQVGIQHLAKEMQIMSYHVKGKQGHRKHHEWLLLRNPETGRIPRAIRSRELQFAQSLPVAGQSTAKANARTVSTQNWTPRGPWNVGGRTRALQLDVSNPDRVLAGGASGGLWVSEDGGATWTRTSSMAATPSATCLAQDIREGHTDTWYYGTGEYYGSGTHSMNGEWWHFWGEGIFKSEDGGESWNRLESTSSDSATFTSPFDVVFRIITNHTNEDQDEVLAALYGCIQRSVDGGETWETVVGSFNPGPDGQLWGNMAWTDIDIGPNGTMYATVANSQTGRGIWRSTDGVTWENILPPNFPTAYQRIVLDVSPQSDSLVYFLGVTPGFGFTEGSDGGISLFKLEVTVVGDIWTDLSQNLPNMSDVYPNGSGSRFTTQGGYDMLVNVHPDDPTAIFVGGSNLFRSDDGFESDDSTYWIAGYNPTWTNIYDPGSMVYPGNHPDVHKMVFDPRNSGTMYLSSDGGVSRTDECLLQPGVNDYMTWTQADGYLTTQFYWVAVNPLEDNNHEISGGMQDNSTWLSFDNDVEALWTIIGPGDGMACAIGAAEQPDWTSYFSSMQYGNAIVRVTMDNEDHNLQGISIVNPPNANFGLWITPYHLDPYDWKSLYVADSRYIWVNEDITGNTTWRIMPNFSINTGNISAFDVSYEPAHVAYIAVSPSSGSTARPTIYHVDNILSTEPVITPSETDIFPRGAWCHSIAIDPADADRALVTFTNYGIQSLFYTSDGGATWTHVSGNLEENEDGSGDGPAVYWVEITRYQGTRPLFLAGTSVGLYSSERLNGSETVWVQEGAETIGHMMVSSMDIRQSDGYIGIGTHGGGTYTAELFLDSPEEAIAEMPAEFAIEQAYPNPFNSTVRLTVALPRNAKATLTIHDLLGRKVATLASEELTAGRHAFTWNAENHASGNYFATLEAEGQVSTVRLSLVK